MLATIAIGVLLLYIMYKYLSPDPETKKILEKVPGPKPLPLIGNAHQLRMGHGPMILYPLSLTDYFLQVLEWARAYPGILVIWLAYRPEVVVSGAAHAENLELAKDFPGIAVVWLAYRPAVVIHNAQLAEQLEFARASPGILAVWLAYAVRISVFKAEYAEVWTNDCTPSPCGQERGQMALPLLCSIIPLIVHEWFLQLFEICKDLPGIGVLWLAFDPRIFVFKAGYAEVVLSSMKHIDKSPDYNFLHPWLGTGLLTSTGNKWKSRRRMLTPTFHFNILHDFLHVFNKKSHILVNKLKGKASKGGQFNLFQDVALCALDIISETAMGKDIDAQSTDSEYVHAVYRMSTLTDSRMRKPWFWPKFLFNLIGPGHEHDEKLKILHDFTSSVISDRLKDFDSIKAEMIRQEMSGEAESGLGNKKIRLAFLDMLIYMSDNLTKLTIEDIREEVDTFMFE
ncbi:cytochrome P450, partial [Elysia marginata]